MHACVFASGYGLYGLERATRRESIVEEDIFAPDMITTSWGGAIDGTVYNHEEYWPALVAMTNERRALWKENWEAMGGKIGLKESDYKKEKAGEQKVETKTESPEEKVETKTEAAQAKTEAPAPPAYT